jgi:hypothetical protein
MKEIKNILLAIIPVIIFIGCDKVSNPNQNPNAITNCVVAPHVVKSNLAKMNFRNVVIVLELRKMQLRLQVFLVIAL